MTGLTGNNAITGAGYRKNQPPYEIDQSLRLDGYPGTTNQHLERSPSSSGNRKTFTISFWHKPSLFAKAENDHYIKVRPDANNQFQVSKVASNDQLLIYIEVGNTGKSLQTTRVFRDPNWYHFVIAVDTTQATASNRVKLYVNGVQETDFGTEQYPDQDWETCYNQSGVNQDLLWSREDSGRSPSGYFAEWNSIDGQALTPSSFGETLASTNQWVPIAYEGSYGTNGFYLSFSSTELNNFVDSASRTVTANGNVHTDTSVKKIGTASAQFDGTGDYLSMLGSPDFDFDTSAFTIEAWVYPTNVTDWMAIFSSPNYYTGGYNGNWVIDMYNGNVRMNVYNGTGAVGNVDGTTSLTASTWQHLAVCRNDSGTTRIFKDGTLISSASTSLNGADIEDGKNGFWIGETTASGGPGDFNGYMDEIRVSKSARYTSNFTPSTTAFTTDSDTMLLLHCDGSDSGTTFTDSSGRPAHTITANGDVTNSRAQKKIGSSSIKFDGTGDYLTVPDSDDWDFGTGDFTVEHWFRPRSIPSSDTHTTIFSGTSWPPGFRFYYGSSAVPYFRVEGSAYEFTGVTLSADTWYHMAASREGTNLRLFIDGDLKATHTDSTNINSSGVLYIGRRGDTTSDDANVYLDEIRISDTARYTSSFTPSTTAFTDDSNTLLLIHSDFDGGLGADSSGNTNDFSATNLVATDQVLDSPTNNFATFFPTGVDPDSDKAMSEGNLKSTFNSGSSGTAHSTLAINDGNKWYAEFLVLGTPASGEPVIGIDNNIGWSSGIGYNASTTNDSIGYVATDGKIYKGGTLVDTESTFTTNDIIQVAFDGSTGRIYFGKNNTWQNSGDPAGGTGYVTTAALEASYIGFACGGHSTGSQAVVANFGQDSSFAGNKTAQSNTDGNGIGDFYYTPPTGFNALCSDNLSDPSIADPTAHFNATTWSGDDSASRAITTGVDADFVWYKDRTGTESHSLYDSIRGAQQRLISNSTDLERTRSGGLQSFDSTGFTVGSDTECNGSGKNYVGWTWKAGGAASSNTDGSITSSVSANTDAGFSIVAWTGTGSNVTVGHGLSQAPDLIINKSRDDAYNWAVQSTLFNSASDTNLLYLNTNAAAADDTNVFQAAPTATVFSPQGGSWSGIGASGVDYIAYCFNSIDGYSKVGSYTGNGATDGVFVYTGFRPSLVIGKNYSDTAGYGWWMIDSTRADYNVAQKVLYPNGSNAEVDSYAIVDFLSNGFKFRIPSSNGNLDTYNGSSDNYVYLAFAESPFKYSNAR